tara:strand:+ start:2765 stop:3580 length:816 start_codon:yes stop_codon:yes gene_type:complete
MDLKNQILVALGLDKESDVKLAWQSKLEDGTIVTSSSDTLEAGVDVSVLTEDGTTIPLPIGTYKTEDGLTFRIEEEGIVAEVMESETEEVVEEVEAAEVGDWEGMEKRIQNLEDAVAKLKEDKDGGDTESEEMADAEDTEEVVEEVIEVVEAAVEEIAAAIDEATPDAVTPELAQQAAEIAVAVLEEKAEEVVAESDGTELAKKKSKSKAKLSKLKRENKRLKSELGKKPASAPIDTNKFSSDKSNNRNYSKQDVSKMSKKEKYLYNLYNN